MAPWRRQTGPSAAASPVRQRVCSVLLARGEAAASHNRRRRGRMEMAAHRAHGRSCDSRRGGDHAAAPACKGGETASSSSGHHSAAASDGRRSERAASAAATLAAAYNAASSAGHNIRIDASGTFGGACQRPAHAIDRSRSGFHAACTAKAFTAAASASSPPQSLRHSATHRRRVPSTLLTRTGDRTANAASSAIRRRLRPFYCRTACLHWQHDRRIIAEPLITAS